MKKMKTQLPKMKESNVTIVQNGAVKLDLEIDTLIETIPDRVAGSHLFVASGGNGIYVIDVQQQRLLPEKREQLYKHLTTEYIQILFLDDAT